jgi:hypothetical protein
MSRTTKRALLSDLSSRPYVIHRVSYFQYIPIVEVQSGISGSVRTTVQAKTHSAWYVHFPKINAVTIHILNQGSTFRLLW